DFGGAARDDGFNAQAPAEPIQALDIEIPRARRRDEGERVYERPSHASRRSIAAVDLHGVVTESQGLDESLSEIALDRSDQETKRGSSVHVGTPSEAGAEEQRRGHAAPPSSASAVSI